MFDLKDIGSRIVSARTHVPMCARTYTMVEW